MAHSHYDDFFTYIESVNNISWLTPNFILYKISSTSVTNMDIFDGWANDQVIEKRLEFGFFWPCFYFALLTRIYPNATKFSLDILLIIFALDNLNKVYFRVDKNISVCKINLRQNAVSAIISTLGSKLNNLVGFKEVLWSTQ